jgi:hypothetical protein
MAISFEHNIEGNTLKIKAHGYDESIADVEEYGFAILSLVIQNGCRHVLCDERDLEYRLSTSDTFDLAEVAAREAKQVEKIAVICDKRFMNEAAFYETVAQNRGLTIRVSADEKSIMEWLKA